MGHLLYSLSTLVMRYTAHAKTELDIGTYGLVWEECVMLKDCRDVALMGWDREDAVTIEENLARVGYLVAAKNTEQRCLATSGRTKENNVSSGLDSETDAGQCDGGSETFADVLDDEFTATVGDRR